MSLGFDDIGHIRKESSHGHLNPLPTYPPILVPPGNGTGFSGESLPASLGPPCLLWGMGPTEKVSTHCCCPGVAIRS